MPNQRHIPQSIYESLPYLYLAGGAIVMASLPNAWGIFSGLLLSSTGVVVWLLRRIYRRASCQPVGPRAWEAAVQNGYRDAGLVPLAWSVEYERGHVTIDTQHRKLFERVNVLLNAILDEKPKLDVELLLDELIKDVSNHFTAEENLLVEASLPLTPEHQESHRTLLARCKEMAERYHNDEIKVGALFNFVARDAVSEHILKDDPKSPVNTG